jgi:hypothetical protein
MHRNRFRTALTLWQTTAGASLLAAAMIAAAAAEAPSDAIHSPGSQQMSRYDDAVQAFHARQYSIAYGRFAELADEGHAPAALMALAMAWHGSSLFGSEWSATYGQLERWSALAVLDVREHGAQFAGHDRGE